MFSDNRKNLRRGAAALVLVLIAFLAWMMWPRDRHTEPFDYITEQARKLEFSAERITAFMRANVKDEAYDGVLRGPLGTLWSGAGNNLDRALLLQALLERAKIKTRLVKGQAYGVELEAKGGFVAAGPDAAAPANAQPLAAPDAALFHTIEIALETVGTGGAQREVLAQLRVADTIGNDLRLSYRRQDKQAFAVLDFAGKQFASKLDAVAAKGQRLIFTLRAPGRPDLQRSRELFTTAFSEFPNLFDPANRYTLVVSAGWIPASVLAKETELAAAWAEPIDAVNHLTAYAFLVQSDRHARALVADKKVNAHFTAPRVTIIGSEIESEDGKIRRAASIDLRLNDVAVDAPPALRAAFQSARSRYDAALESSVLTGMTGDPAYSASDVLADGYQRLPTALVQRQFLLNISLGRMLYEAKPGASLSLAPLERPDLALRVEMRGKDQLAIVTGEKLKQALDKAGGTGDLGFLKQPQFARDDIERIAQEIEVAFALAGKLPMRYELEFAYNEAPAGEWYRGARLFFRDDKQQLVFERQYLALEPDMVVETLDYFDDRKREFYEVPHKNTVRATGAELDAAPIITSWYFSGDGNRGSLPEMLSHAAFQELKRNGSVVLRVRMGDRADSEPIRFWLYDRNELELLVNQTTLKVPLLTVLGTFTSTTTKPATPNDVKPIMDPANNGTINYLYVLDDPKFPIFGVLGAEIQTAIPGRITDAQSGRGVPLARVAIDEVKVDAIAWPDGRFSLPLIKEPFREFEVRVSAPGYKPLTLKVDLRKGENLPLALKLEPERVDGGFAWFDKANIADLARTGLSPRSRALISEAIAANGDLRVGVPNFSVFAPYGATEAWIEFDTVAMTEYPRMIDGLYGSTSQKVVFNIATVSGSLASDAWYYLKDDIIKWAGNKALEKVRKLPNGVISYFFGRIAAWYLFAAGAMDSVGMAVVQGGASMEAMYKNAVKKAYEFAKMYDQGFLFDRILDKAGGNYTTFKAGLNDGLGWASEYYKKAWGL